MGMWGLVATAFVVGLSGAMAPGSLLVVVVTETVRKGFWAGPAVLAGHFVTEASMVGLLALGLGRVLAYRAAFGVIGLVGGAMLFWFGWTAWKTARSATLSFDGRAVVSPGDGEAEAGGRPLPAGRTPDRRRGLWSAGVAGVAASISNPYWIFWWATVGAAYVAAGMSYGVAGPATFYVGHISADAVWYLLVSFAVSTGSRFLSGKFYRGILYACGMFLFLLGAHFLKVGFGSVTGR
jgi:threonine/homoserine/homoserine lactone efflux protein